MYLVRSTWTPGKVARILSRFNLPIHYYPGDKNVLADRMSRWAYPAGVAQDTNFHGSDADLLGWNEAEQQECREQQRVLQQKYPHAFGPIKERLRDETKRGKSVFTGEVLTMESQERALHVLHRCRIAATSLYGMDSPPEYCFSHSGTETVQVTKDVSIFFEHTLHEHDMSVASLPSTLPAGSALWTQLVDTFCDLNWHMPGSEQLMMMSKVKVPPDVSILHQDLQGYYVQDPLYQEFWQELESDGVARDGDSNSFFILYKGKVRCNTKICVPQGILEKVFKGIHTYAHPGIDKTVQLFNRKFVVPDPEFTQSKLKETVSKVVGHCRVCQTAKHRKGVQPDTLDPYPIPDNIFDSIAVDFLDLTGNPVTERKVEYNYVLVVVCCLSGYIIAILCHNTLTSKELARIFVHHIFPHWGLPSVICSDNDHSVNAQSCKEFFMLSGAEEHKSPI